MGFTHLHVASACSAHHGTAWPDELVQAAAATGAGTAALTDRDGLYGAARHIAACLAAGLTPIVGVDLHVGPPDRLSEVTVLAHGHDQGAGWSSLARLISAAHTPPRGAKRPLPHGSAHRAAVLAKDRPAAFLRADGRPTATVLLGPGSDVGQAVLAGERANARELLLDWRARLPGGVAVELVCHHTRPGTARSLGHAAALLELARATDTPAILTNAVRYLTPDDAVTGDVLDAAALLLPLGAFEPQPNAQAWLKPPDQMEAIARDIAEYAGVGRQGAFDVLAATERLAARCRLDPVSDVGWMKPKTPELAALGLTGDPRDLLRRRCADALPERYPHADRALRDRLCDRLGFELDTIAGFGFETYFLTVADVADLIRRLGVRVQARGSGASSLVNYLLRISSVDPLEHDLVFERFLGNKRSTLPDIDLDVESARRHDIYRAIFARYGHHRVTLLSMQNRYRARGATRDVGLALGLDDAQIDQIATQIWNHRGRTLRQELDQPELRGVKTLAQANARIDLLVDLAERLDRLPRHISMHPCGVILGPADLLSVTPVQPSGLGLPMSQFDKDDVDGMGLLKLDVLGVRMQSAMAYALGEIIRVHGPRAAVAGGLPPDAPYVSPAGCVDLEGLPHDDEPTFEAIRSTHTLGMFQIESPGQRELIGKMQPDQYADLIADISLFRPGPMKGNMVTPFLESKHGFIPPLVLHPRFSQFLADSYGVVIYHEHVLRILHDCMGVTLAEADELRRAMGSEMGHVERLFRQQTALRRDEAGRRLFSDQDINRIWATLAGFGSFGFCKAHGAAFACTTYQSAWLKTHYPAEFLAGLFEHDPGMYPRRLLVAEARRLGIAILPLDVNASTDHYRVERPGDGPGIRLSLRDVHGITGAETARILAGQPYESIPDFLARANPSRRLAGRLAAVGALDSLGDLTRGQVIATVRHLTAQPKRLRPPAHQALLVTEDPGLDAALQPAPPAQPALFEVDDPWAADGEPTPQQRIAAELAILSTEISDHVIECYRPLLTELGVTPADQLLGLRNNSEVFVAGIRVATQTPPMRSGQRVVFISLDDGSGCADCTFFPDSQEKVGPLLFGTRLMVVQGRTRRTGERGVSIQADQAWDLKALWRRWRHGQL
ncbi:MAG: DNA polymerase III subunit alpha [Propionibacteriaceae bacterium]|jgi:error-prone DNA polymerase|nr:DNA polymerase III subunit alpha [Propionibacteriaceae bacterium]